MSLPLKNIDESAEILGKISPWTVRHYLKIGKIKGVKIGARHMIELRELHAFVSRCKEESDRQAVENCDDSSCVLGTPDYEPEVIEPPDHLENLSKDERLLTDKVKT